MEENSNVYKTNSDSADNAQGVRTDSAEQSSVYGQQQNMPSFAEIVQQKPENYQSPGVEPQASANPQAVYGQQQSAESPQAVYDQQQSAGNVQAPYGQQQSAGNAQAVYGQQQSAGNAQAPYGQQQGAGPSPYMQQPTPGLQYQQPKKGKAGIVIAVIAVLVVLVGGIGAFMLLKGRNFGTRDPQKLLEQGLAIRVKENEAYTASLSDMLGSELIQKRKEEDPYHMNASLSFTIPASYDLDNISVELDAVTDESQDMGEYELSVGTYGFKISVGSMITANNMLYFTSPFLQQDTYHIDLETAAEDFEDSAWAELLEIELPEGYPMNLIEDAADSESMEEELKALAEKHSAILKESRKIELLEEPKEFELHGKKEKCSGVSITIGKDAMNEFIEGFKADFMDSNYYKTLLDSVASQQAFDEMDIEEYQRQVDEAMETLFAIRLEQDFVLNVYMDSKGRIINQSTPEDIRVSGSGIELFSIDINYLGEERAMDVIDAFCYFESADEAWYFGIDRNAEVSEEVYKESWTCSLGEVDGFELSLAYENEWNHSERSFDMEITLLATDEYGYADDFTVTADGVYTGVVKGETYTLEIDNAALSYNGDTMIMMSGKIVGEFTSEAIEVPEDSINLLKMTEEDIEDMLFGSMSMYY